MVNVSISVDKITLFSIRPPEIHVLVKKVEQYYHWFFVKRKRMSRDHVVISLTRSVESSLWVDGLQNQVFFCIKELPEIAEYLDSE